MYDMGYVVFMLLFGPMSKRSAVKYTTAKPTHLVMLGLKALWSMSTRTFLNSEWWVVA